MADQNAKHQSTSLLLRKLFSTPDIETFMECNSNALVVPAFHNYLNTLCKEKGQIPEQVIKRAAIERTYGHQLFNGRRKPSRDKVIQLAIGLELDLSETQELLQVAQKSELYPKIKRDAAIIHCIHYKKDIYETQTLLHALGLSLLSCEKK